jgi:ACS family hexuronate transporter-like MFS transporter
VTGCLSPGRLFCPPRHKILARRPFPGYTPLREPPSLPEEVEPTAMSAPFAKSVHPARGAAWTWWVCVLLLLATTINYMDRLTLNLTAWRIRDELHLSYEQYGLVEFAFGIAFAVGALFLGLVVDRWNVRWVYPATLLVWSAAGFATGFARSLWDLLLIRSLLGLAEAGNWPCGLRTTQRILPPQDRTLGNGLLQSGSAVGAVLMPLVVAQLVSGPGTWRLPFLVVGAAGMGWVFLWLASVRGPDLALARPGDSPVGPPERHSSAWAIFRDPRFAVLLIVTTTINLNWHFLRVWLPLALVRFYRYPERTALWCVMAFYVAAGVGSLVSGTVTLRLGRGRLGVHGSRVMMFAFFAVLAALPLWVAELPPGPLLLALLLVIGFAALGLYPVYYSLSQELTVRHQGKVTGVLGCTTWVVTAAMQPVVGLWIDKTHDWPTAFSWASAMPLLGLLALLLLWQASPAPEPPRVEADPTPLPADRVESVEAPYGCSGAGSA